MRACRLALWARRFCPASRTWSSLVRVIAPAHRDDASAVSARFRTARDRVRPRASSRPSVHRAARSFPASDPRCPPTARSTASSCADRRSRARTRAPAGAAATNGAATGRSQLVTSVPPRRPGRDGKRVYVRKGTSIQGTASTRFRYLRHAGRGNSAYPYDGRVKPVLDGTVALVTGASSGIGAATAAALAAQGPTGALAARRGDRLARPPAPLTDPGAPPPA